MTAKKSSKLANVKTYWPYFLAAAAVVAVAVYGSNDKVSYSENSMDIASIVSSNRQVSADQVSQFYIVAEMADAMNLASANLASNNYTTVSLLQQDGQIINETGKLSKPIAVDISSVSRGVVQYTVGEGESLDVIARKYGVTTDQLRWSNGLKTTDISPGQSLLVPSVPGIVYTVKDGDNVNSLAEKYNSTAAEIISVNDLEKDQNLSSGSAILIPNGVLPETERPEYVVPTSAYASSYSSSASSATSYHYAASYASGNRYAYGWCTWYAWQWRHDNMPGNYDLPSNMGNANAWARAAAAAGFTVNRTPAYGAVFQHSVGLGHVGIVMKVNSDGSVVISDMNGIAGWGRVGTKTISASAAAAYTYIHGR